MRIARFGSNGALDTTAGGGTGYRDVVVPAGPLRSAYTSQLTLALQSDGKPIVAAVAGSAPEIGAVVRYGADLADDAVVLPDVRPAAAFVLPGGRLLLGVLGFDPPAVERRLGDGDGPTCTSTSTVVSTSPNPSRFGEAVTLTADVSPTSGSEVPTGLVQFSSDGTSLGSPIALGGGTAAMVTSSLAEGLRTITAAYAGGPGFLGSTSAPVIHTVTSRPLSLTTLSSSPNPSVYGQAVTLTATVSPASGSGTATGTVDFQVDGQGPTPRPTT